MLTEPSHRPHNAMVTESNRVAGSSKQDKTLTHHLSTSQIGMPQGQHKIVFHEKHLSLLPGTTMSNALGGRPTPHYITAMAMSVLVSACSQCTDTPHNGLHVQTVHTPLHEERGLQKQQSTGHYNTPGTLATCVQSTCMDMYLLSA